MTLVNSEKEFCININGLSIPCSVTVSLKAKHIKLIMDFNGLRVVKPLKAKISEVDKVLKSKSNWIHKHYISFQSIRVQEDERNWESGEKILYLGDRYELRIILHKKKLTFIDFDGYQFEISVNENLEGSERKAQIEKAIRKWYAQKAYETIKIRLDYFCMMSGLKYNAMRVKDQKSRWGSCSKKGNLNFNWKLIMSPQWIMDYVIIHEVCHLRHLNHSREFWDLVARYMPDYKKAKLWLKKNGSGLCLR